MLAAHASATTYVVAQNGGGQFTDIPPAIAASQPGDVLLVQSGAYSAFTLNKGLVIIGYGNPAITGTATISGVPAEQTAALLKCFPTQLSIANCVGAVIVQDLEPPGHPLGHIAVQNSRDVRFRKLNAAMPVNSTLNACDVSTSRVEIVGGSLTGAPAFACTSGNGTNGGYFLSSRVQFALANATGGDGGVCPFPALGGNGGSGIVMQGSTALILTGGGVSVLWGGDEGGDSSYQDCSANGHPGSPVLSYGGTLWWSGAQFYCYDWYYGHLCLDLGCNPDPGGTQVTPDDPTLEMSGNPIAQQTVQFSLRAPPGSTAILYFGRTAIVVPTPNVLIEQLTPMAHVIDLGAVPASGIVTQNWPIAAGLPPGTMFIAQAEITVGPGDVRHTNSVPVILH
jgi:hypothetical protein